MGRSLGNNMILALFGCIKIVAIIIIFIFSMNLILGPLKGKRNSYGGNFETIRCLFSLLPFRSKCPPFLDGELQTTMTIYFH